VSSCRSQGSLDTVLADWAPLQCHLFQLAPALTAPHRARRRALRQRAVRDPGPGRLHPGGGSRASPQRQTPPLWSDAMQKLVSELKTTNATTLYIAF
jgi:hypothetical protein